MKFGLEFQRSASELERDLRIAPATDQCHRRIPSGDIEVKQTTFESNGAGKAMLLRRQCEWIHIVVNNPMPPTSQGSYTHLLWQLLGSRGGRDAVLATYDADALVLSEGATVPVFHSQQRQSWSHRLRGKISKSRFKWVLRATNHPMAVDAATLASHLNCNRICVWGAHWLIPQIRRLIPRCHLMFAQRHYSFAHESCSYNDCDVVVMQTPGQARYAFDHYDAIAPIVYLVPNGVELEQFTPPSKDDKLAIRSQLGISAESAVVIFPSKLAPHKGTAYLCELIRHFENRNDVVFLIAGDLHRSLKVHHRDAMHELLSTARNVKWMRNVPRSSMPQVYQAADICIMPCVWREGFSMSALEAMSSGLPIVATATGFYPEVVQAGVTGLLLRPEFLLDDLVRAVAHLVENDSERRIMGKCARQEAERNYPRERPLRAFNALLSGRESEAWIPRNLSETIRRSVNADCP